jgi:hypothetical protein
MNRQGRNTLLPKPSSSLVKRSQRACPQAQPCFLMREVR